MSTTQEQSAVPVAETQQIEQEIRTLVFDFWQAVPSNGGYVDPWKLLDISPTDDKREIRQVKIAIAKLLHVDSLVGKNIDPLLVEAANEVQAIINNTCDALINTDQPRKAGKIRISARSVLLNGETSPSASSQQVSANKKQSDRETETGDSEGSKMSHQEQMAYFEQLLLGLNSAKLLVDGLAALKSRGFHILPLEGGNYQRIEDISAAIIFYLKHVITTQDQKIISLALENIPTSYHFREIVRDEQEKMADSVQRLWGSEDIEECLRLVTTLADEKASALTLESTSAIGRFLDFKQVKEKMEQIIKLIGIQAYPQAQAEIDKLPDQFGIKLKMAQYMEQRARTSLGGSFWNIRRGLRNVFTSSEEEKSEYGKVFTAIQLSSLKPGQFLTLGFESSFVTLLVVACSSSQTGGVDKNTVEFQFFSGSEMMRKMSGIAVDRKLKLGDTLMLNPVGREKSSNKALPEVTNISSIQLSLSPIPV